MIESKTTGSLSNTANKTGAEPEGSGFKAPSAIPAFNTDELARKIHEAKIIECWGKNRLAERLAKEPWEKPNIASPNEPWHDIALAQARAAIKYFREQTL